MKVTVDIDCTPLEARQFFGLPDVQPMQQAILAEMEKRTLAEMEKFSPENMLQTWFSSGQQGADMFAKLLSRMALTPGEKSQVMRAWTVAGLLMALGGSAEAAAPPRGRGRKRHGRKRAKARQRDSASRF